MLLAGVPMMTPQPVQSQTKEQITTVRKAIDKAYKAEDAAFVDFDVEGSMQNHAANYVHITKKGSRYNREQVQQIVALMLKSAEKISSSTVIERFTLNGNRAVVRIKTQSRMNLPGRNGTTRVFSGTERRDDTWVKQGGKWLRTQGKQISSYDTIDGKRVG
jgi:hypothetical protein